MSEIVVSDVGVTGSQTKGKLFEALAKAQSEFEIARFDSENPHFRNKFASLRSIDEATKRQLAKHGLAVTQLPYTDASGHPRMMTVLGHSSGEWISSDVKLILSKQDMQGLGSAITYARRYCKSALIGVVSDEDDDGNAASSRSDVAQSNVNIEDGLQWDGESICKLDVPRTVLGNWKVTFGKHKGKALKEIPGEYLNWLVFEKAYKEKADNKIGFDLAHVVSHVQEYLVEQGEVSPDQRVLAYKEY